MAFHFIQQNSGRGTVFTTRINEQTISMMIQDNILESAKQPAQAIKTVFAQVGTEAENMNRDLTNEGRKNKLRKDCAKIKKPFQDLIESGIAGSQRIAQTYARLDELPEPSALDPIICQHWLALDSSEQAEFINRSNSIQLAAVIRLGREITMPGGDPQIWQSLVSRYRRLGLVASYGLQAQFAGTATVEDPFAPARPDPVRAENAANDALRAVTDDAAQVENLGRLVQQTAAIVAVMTGVHISTAFAFLMGEEALP